MGNGYQPSLRSQVVGGIQWSLTATWTFLAVSAATVLFLRSEGSGPELSFGRVLVPIAVTAFVAGVVWIRQNTTSREQELRENVRRLEIIILLFVLWFVFQVAVTGALAVLGVSLFDLPFGATFFVALVLTLVVSYGVEYGVDRRLLFPVD